MRDTSTWIADEVIFHKKISKKCQLFFVKKKPDVSGVWPFFSVRKRYHLSVSYLHFRILATEVGAMFRLHVKLPCWSLVTDNPM